MACAVVRPIGIGSHPRCRECIVLLAAGKSEFSWKRLNPEREERRWVIWKLGRNGSHNSLLFDLLSGTLVSCSPNPDIITQNPGSLQVDYLTLHPFQPSSPRLPHLDHLHRKQKPSSNTNHTSRKRLCPLVPSTAINDGPRNRRPRQRRKAHNRKDHAHPHPRLGQVRRQKRQARGEQALDARSQEAVADGPDVEVGSCLDGHPREDADGRGECDGHEQVDRADAVGDVVGDDAADEAHAVENEEEVEGARV